MDIREEIENDNTSYYKPRQIEEAHEELRRLDEIAQASQKYGANVDGPGLWRRKQQVEKELDQYTPKPIEKDQLDAAVELEKELLSEITEGMPSQVEMRTAAPGAVDKHMQWEKRNKKKIGTLRRLRQRLAASGVEFSNPLGGTFDWQSSELLSVEPYRPHVTHHDVNIDDGLVKKKDYHNAERVDGSGVVLTKDELAFLHENYPAYASQIVAMDNEERKQVKELVQDAMNAKKTPIHPRTGKKKKGRPRKTEARSNA